MLFAYIDESGDPSGDPAHRGSPAYTLGIVLVRGEDWVDAFDGLIALRRELRQNLGVPARAEVKASYLVRNDGPFTSLGLSANQRRYIYRRHMAILAPLRARAFAVFVDKQAMAAQGRLHETRDLVWETLFQRLTLTHDRDVPDQRTPILLVHDEGEDLTIRKLARKARRYLTSGKAYGPPGTFRLSQRWLLDDPVSRQSHHSLFVQCADLVAYAATKRLIPGGRRQTRVCPPATWEHLGDACHRPVNLLATQRDASVPGGIVIRR
ncbi:DUF3800 domain-containing protein [Actinoplanes sp. TRM 88003]|uniref:DUF3800 domain-containing protein n=1 Tax=Paractinoplanes aksuensis TaxID=2939490 RepID=A0ABT1E0F7_9ACTN|nr:DUF3800 domain-containing protein [Actinoplanes aksuensis]MCO8276502.1 DUF3800 domain-containing protein [Actinoplanes aksuensis]